MIRVVLTIEEESPRAIRFRCKGEDVGGNPSNLEVEFTTYILKEVSEAKGNFQKTQHMIPLTIITEARKPDEDTNRN